MGQEGKEKIAGAMKTMEENYQRQNTYTASEVIGVSERGRTVIKASEKGRAIVRASELDRTIIMAYKRDRTNVCNLYPVPYKAGKSGLHLL